MLAHIRNHDRFVKDTVNSINYILGRHDGLLSHLHRMLLLPLIHHGKPFLRITFRYILQHPANGILRVCHHRNIHLYILGDRRRVDIYMDNLRMRGKRMQFPRDSVIEPRPDREEQITLAHRHIARVGPVHSQIPDI